MSIHLRLISAATLAAFATLAFASEKNGPNGTNAPHNPATYKLVCLGLGNSTIFANLGSAPVPAGTAINWQTKKTQYMAARGGTYTFAEPLQPLAMVTLNPPPAPSSAQNSSYVPIGAYLELPQALADASEPCTLQVEPKLEHPIEPGGAAVAH